MTKIITLSVLLLTAFVVYPSQAKDFTRSDIESIVREYIQKNPKIILDSVEDYSRGQKRVDSQKQQEAIKKHMGWLEDNKMLPVAGNPEGDVTIVEFFDYNCGYCKKAMDDVLTLLNDDKKVKFVFVETPILGKTSELAAKWAMAAQEQDAYLEYHVALMKHRGPLSELSLQTIAKKVGLDIEKIKKDAASDRVAKKVREKSNKAAEMGISGTPAFIIDGQLYGGYIGIDRMRDAIKQAREKK